MTIPYIPCELLCNICSHLGGGDLFRAALTNKELSESALRMLYRHIRIKERTPIQIYTLARTLGERSDRAELVRTIRIDYKDTYGNNGVSPVPFQDSSWWLQLID